MPHPTASLLRATCSAALRWLSISLIVTTLSAADSPPPIPRTDWQRSDGAVVRGPKTARRLALVFTGHEFAEGAPAILDALASHGWHGSFFLTGDFLDRIEFRPIIERVVRDGHLLGPHSDQHLLYCSWAPQKERLISRSAFEKDLRANLTKLARFQSVPPRFFLPPYEHADQAIADWSAQCGLTLVNYTPGTRSPADYTEDEAKNFVSSQTIFDSILQREASDPDGLNGYLLLLHLGAGPRRSDKFASRLPELLAFLQRRGYVSVRLDSLLNSTDAPPPARPPVFLRVQQWSYHPASPKSAVALSTGAIPPHLEIRQADSDQVVWQGALRQLPKETWGQFHHLAEADFSTFRVPGRYVLSAGAARSTPFSISTHPSYIEPEAMLAFIRQQRCGDNPWLPARCHTQDGRTAYGPLPPGTAIDATGGWHDAADLLKYHLTSGHATAQLLLAWLLGAEHSRGSSLAGNFSDLADDRGYPGQNGQPDLLDEARWGLAWMLKMHPSREQLYHQVADDRDHAGLRLPQHEIADYGWGPGGPRVVYAADGQPQGLSRYQSESTGLANIAGRFAAAMGLAWQVWKDRPHERPWAERCLAAGREVYELGRAQEGVQQGNSFRAPYRYEERTWADDMEWGAAELFRATGEAHYLSDAKRYALIAGSETWMGRVQTAHYEFYPFLNLGHFRLHGLVNRSWQRRLEGFYRDGLERCRAAASRQPFGVGVPFIWCSNHLVLALATQGWLYERMSGDTHYRKFITQQQDWLLGRNPWGVCMFTELGTAYPRNVHLMTAHLTGRRIPGALVDGPVYERIFKGLRGVSITEPDPWSPFQDARAVYHDDFQDYATNEPTLDGTASAVLWWVVRTLHDGPSPVPANR